MTGSVFFNDIGHANIILKELKILLNVETYGLLIEISCMAIFNFLVNFFLRYLILF